MKKERKKKKKKRKKKGELLKYGLCCENCALYIIP